MLTRDFRLLEERTRHSLKPLFSNFLFPLPSATTRLDIRLRRAALYPAELRVPLGAKLRRTGPRDSRSAEVRQWFFALPFAGSAAPEARPKRSWTPPQRSLRIKNAGPSGRLRHPEPTAGGFAIREPWARTRKAPVIDRRAIQGLHGPAAVRSPQRPEAPPSSFGRGRKI